MPRSHQFASTLSKAWEAKVELFPEFAQKRAANARKFAAFGVTVAATDTGLVRTVLRGHGVTIYTVGYERRDGENLMSALRDQGVRAIADVRERPTSRKADFRAANLKQLCDAARIGYQPWPMLGSTVEQRDELHASGNFGRFADEFRSHAMARMGKDLERLAQSVQRIPTALLCYERSHDDCHRSIIAELLAAKLDATIVAIE
jgi:uncharacterized protein (DUF488 family)